MSETKDVLILAIESSCDETAYIVWRCCAGDCIQKTYRKD